MIKRKMQNIHDSTKKKRRGVLEHRAIPNPIRRIEARRESQSGTPVTTHTSPRTLPRTPGPATSGDRTASYAHGSCRHACVRVRPTTASTEAPGRDPPGFMPRVPLSRCRAVTVQERYPVLEVARPDSGSPSLRRCRSGGRFLGALDRDASLAPSGLRERPKKIPAPPTAAFVLCLRAWRGFGPTQFGR